MGLPQSHMVSKQHRIFRLQYQPSKGKDKHLPLTLDFIVSVTDHSPSTGPCVYFLMNFSPETLRRPHSFPEGQASAPVPPLHPSGLPGHTALPHFPDMDDSTSLHMKTFVHVDLIT